MTKYAVHNVVLEHSKSPFLYKMDITEKNLDLLKQQYHEVRGHPAFIREFLAGNPSSNAIRMLLNNPDFVTWGDDGSFVIIPNSPYIERDELETNTKHYKDKTGGLALNAWFIHPKQLEESIFSNPEIRKNPKLIQQHYSYVPSLEKTYDVERLDNQKRIRQLEEESGVRYLSSVFDLTREDVPWLKKLKATAMENLQKEYGVTADDKVDLFFHSVISLGTTTLHLHIRVNQQISPMEKQGSIGLDEIIGGLENGKTINEMMLERGVVYHGIKPDNCPKTKEGTVRVPNPFLQKSIRGFEIPIISDLHSFVDKLFNNSAPNLQAVPTR